MLVEFLNEEMELGPPPEEGDELKKVIPATTHNVIESDKKKELMGLLAVTEGFIGDVLQLEKLIDAFLISRAIDIVFILYSHGRMTHKTRRICYLS